MNTVSIAQFFAQEAIGGAILGSDFKYNGSDRWLNHDPCRACYPIFLGGCTRFNLKDSPDLHA